LLATGLELSKQLDGWLSAADLSHGPARAIIAPLVIQHNIFFKYIKKTRILVCVLARVYVCIKISTILGTQDTAIAEHVLVLLTDKLVP